MRRFVLGLIVILLAALILTVAGVWSASYLWSIRLEGSADSVRHQLVAVRGQLSWWRCDHWWRVEEWSVLLDPNTSREPVEDWPGLSLESHRRGLGFETASGKWKSPVFEVTKYDKILAKTRIPVGSMFSTLVPFQLVVVPLWAALIACVLAFTLLFRIWKRSRTRQLGK